MNDGTIAGKLPPKYRVRIARNGGASFRYFDTLDEALSYDHPQEFDFFGLPRRKPRITVQENVNGERNKYKKVDGLVSIRVGGGKVTVRAL